MGKFYFAPTIERDICYTLRYWKEYIKEKSIKELELFEAKKVDNGLFFYCKHFNEVCDKYVSCGRFCEGYKPLNGKQGRCFNYGYCYDKGYKILIKNKKQ